MYLLGILLSPRYIYILRFALASMTPKLIIHEQGRNGGRNDTRQRGGGRGQSLELRPLFICAEFLDRALNNSHLITNMHGIS